MQVELWDQSSHLARATSESPELAHILRTAVQGQLSPTSAEVVDISMVDLKRRNDLGPRAFLRLLQNV